tara:strand:- start:3892 stop:4629 length:738 start_codon:yes stop_codon:yes gene_type:complete
MNDHISLDNKNREIYKKKKILQLIYNNYFKLIKKNLFENSKLPILEIGSSGYIKETIPECITSNLTNDNQMIDLEENIFKLNQKDKSLSNVIMVDIFHHLKYPKFALKNIHRVLCNNGRVIMVEPAMGLIPRIIYKIFHHEPNGFDFKIEWDEKPKKIPGKNEYFAAQSIPWRAFIKKELKLDEMFEIKKIQCFSDFSFLASGGYSYISFYPKILFNMVKFLDRFLTILSKNIFSARMLVVLEKK